MIRLDCVTEASFAFLFAKGNSCSIQPWRNWLAIVTALGLVSFMSIRIEAQSPHPVISKDIGISSCFTSTCHGSSSADGPTWSRSAIAWLNQDPHATAFSTLLDPWSVDIVSKLTGGNVRTDDKVRYFGFLNDNCVTCHASVGSTDSQLELGVNCQSCHGAASAWDSSHWQQTKPPSQESSAPIGRKNLRELPTRIRTCVDCHIGIIDPATNTVREVTHELIAAGHPPLLFEFESFFRRLPKHWDAGKDQESLGESAPFVRWQAGVLLSASSRLNLFASRMERTSPDVGQKSQSNAHAGWPELAEFNCFDCHHELSSGSWREQRSHLAATRVRWDSWTRQSLMLAIDSVEAEQRSKLSDISERLDQLAKNIELQNTQQDRLARQARQISQSIAFEFDRLTTEQRLTPSESRQFTERWLASQSNGTSWEAVMQWQLALAAASRSLKMERLEEELSHLEQEMLGVHRISIFDFPRMAREPQRLSPRGFDPKVLEQRRLRLVEIYSLENRR